VIPGFIKIKKYQVVAAIVLVVTGLCNIMGSTVNPKTIQPLTTGEEGGFAGSASCASCHKDIYESHIRTAHYFTSRPASKESIKGSFEAGKNHYIYNKFMEVVLENDNDSFFQTAYVNGVAIQSEPFGVVIGSGRKGQTYLYWDSNKLFQLPVSYYTPLDSWCNSPSYPTNYIMFNRPIPGHCIECHGTYAKTDGEVGGNTLFEKNKIIYGVDCERCHGPAAEHVAFHTSHPDEKKPMFIINAKRLDRQRRLDACALCHSGFRKEIKPAFSFTVGEKLDEYSVPGYNADTVSTLDVHGNQYGLLTSSKCFRMSEQLDCSSCHNVHANEVSSPKLFSSRCMNCHNTSNHNTCTIKKMKGLVLADNCIDCHMPALPSKAIFLQLSDPSKSTPDLVRTHRVSIYPKNTKEFLEKLKGG
jgi:Cytochrome c554 and c-prime